MEKIKVKCFEANSRVAKLEEAINDFLNENDVEIVDVKFSSADGLSNGRSFSSYAALVLYKER